MPQPNTAVTHRHVVIPQNLDTLPSTGKLGDRNFQPIEGGESGRATESRKPPVAPRKLTLVNGQEGSPTATRSSPALSVATTQGSDEPQPLSKSTPFESQAENLNEVDGTFTRHPSVGDLDAHNDRFSRRTHSLTRYEYPVPHSASAPPDNDTSSLGLGENPSHNIAPQVVEETVELSPATGINERAIDVPPPPSTKPLRVRVPRGAPAAPARTETMRPPAAVIARPDQHPDVGLAINQLVKAVTQAATQAPAPSEKKTRYTGAAPLRAIARAQRHSPDALHGRALGLYKSLIALSRDPNGAATQKQAAIMLAALAQRASAEGAQAVDQDLIKRVLTPMLHSLPVETLCELGRLNDANNGLGDKILHDAGKLLGADKSPHTPAGARARREFEVASALLGVVAELSREHARAASWDGQISVALEAARNGQHQRLDAALREMWQGDLLAGDIDRPRVARLANMMRRLGVDQQDALARMLGTAGPADAATANFNDFESLHLEEFERDPTIHRQMLGFIGHLRAASQATRGAGANPAELPQPPDTQQGADATAYPEPLRPRGTFRSTFRQLRASVASAFRRQPTTRDAAKAQIHQAVRHLIDGDRLTANQLEVLQSANRKLTEKMGQSSGMLYQSALIQDQLSRLTSGQMAQLDVNLAAARNELDASAEENASLTAFYNMLHKRLQGEIHIRRGATALAQVLSALRQTRHPEKLLAALDVLADAQFRAPQQQSELDFYGDALGRLGETARAALQKHLKGRADVQRHMRGIDGELSYAPAPWLQYRRSQLDTLSIAARTTV